MHTNRDNLKKLREMKKNDGNSQTNVVMTMEDDVVVLATVEEVTESKRVMYSTAAKHICRDQTMHDTLKTMGEFDHFMLGNGEEIKLEGI